MTLTALFISAGLQAGTYRWVDENGVTVYSQTPPPPDVQSTRIKAPPPPPENAGQGSLENLEQQYQKMQDRDDIRKENQIKQEEDEALQQARAQNCQAGKHNLTILEGTTRSLIKTPDGEYHRLTEEQRQQGIAEANKIIEQNCD